MTRKPNNIPTVDTTKEGFEKAMDKLEAKQHEATQAAQANANKVNKAMETTLANSSTALLDKCWSDFEKDYKDDDKTLNLIIAVMAAPAAFENIPGLIRGDELYKEGAQVTGRGKAKKLRYTAANQQRYALRQAMPAFEAMHQKAIAAAAKVKEVKRTAKMTTLTWQQRMRKEEIVAASANATGKHEAQYKCDAFLEMFGRALPVCYMLQQLKAHDLNKSKSKVLSFNALAFDPNDSAANPGTDIEEYHWPLATLTRYGRHFIIAHKIENKNARKPRPTKVAEKDAAAEQATAQTPTVSVAMKELSKSVRKLDEKTKAKFAKNAHTLELLDDILLAKFVSEGHWNNVAFKQYLSGIAAKYKFTISELLDSNGVSKESAAQ